MIKKLLNLWLFCLLFSPFALSQDGTLDPSFGGDGIVYTDFDGQIDHSYAVMEQTDGKIVAFGFSEYGDFHSLARYFPDGTLDPSFGTEGKVKYDFNNDPLFNFYCSIAQQADEKIVTGAAHRLPGSNQDFILVRYLTNGDLDTSFGNNGTVMTDHGSDILSGLAILPDGAILAGGWSTLGSSDYLLLAKYLPNGNPDTSFGNNGIVATDLNYQNAIVFPFKVLSDGKILVGFRGEEGKLTFHRYLEKGMLDPDFGNNGIVQTVIGSGELFGSIEVKDDGKIVTAVKLSGSNVLIAQFLPNGDLDTSFGTDGTTVIDIFLFVPWKVMVDENDKILVCGNIIGFEPSGFYTMRYDANGVQDTGFETVGAVQLAFWNATATLQNDGRILVTGELGLNFVVARLRNGLLDIPDNESVQLVLYPNPSHGLFSIKSDDFLDGITYRITDMTGKLLQQGAISGNQTTIDLTMMSNGLYFLNAGQSTIRLVKE